MRKYENFIGFSFGKYHSSELNLKAVSSGSRYNKNLLPSPDNATEEVPGGNGSYYFGSTDKSRNFKINIAFDSVTEDNFREISNLLHCDKLQDLIFDEQPYKIYKAKISSEPEFKFICFTDPETNERIYKGEGTITFQCFYPYALCENKYIVRAADYYKENTPERIIKSVQVNPYKANTDKNFNPNKKFYNVENNMNQPWKGGYPSIKQVQAGELFWNEPKFDRDIASKTDVPFKQYTEKSIIDVQGYWDKIPEWEKGAKLLYTPTLDYDGELIYMPQYNRLNYINMDQGVNSTQAILGSRFLVYNPGDLPIDFELRLGNLKKSIRENNLDYDFMIRRFNVERLTIEEAVDWVGLKTQSPYIEEANYKYGNKYFKKPIAIEDENQGITIQYEDLTCRHPKHTYIVEPIPKERLGHYIRLFFWQSAQLKIFSKTSYYNIQGTFPAIQRTLPTSDEECWEYGVEFANKYEELYNEATTEKERQKLYWETLHQLLFFYYDIHFRLISHYVAQNDAKKLRTYEIFDSFVESYILNPPEYIEEDKSIEESHPHKYGQFEFNLGRLPQWITEDYLRISTKDLIENSNCFKPLFIDFEKRMCYNIFNPVWNPDKDSPDFDNFYNYKPEKLLKTDNIKQGKWFKLPPGWSLIDVSPIINEDKKGGKRWTDARPFIYSDVTKVDNKYKREKIDEVLFSTIYNYIYDNMPPDTFASTNLERDDYQLYYIERDEQTGEITTKEPMDLKNTKHQGALLDGIKFRRWNLYDGGGRYKSTFLNDSIQYYENMKLRNLIYDWNYKKGEDYEYSFLRQLATNMKVALDYNIDDWFWFADNYIWDNFPPSYWGYVDLLNKIDIKYTPLFL